MSYETGTATDYMDFLDKLNTFLTAKGSAFGVSFAGTGTGKLTFYNGGASSVAEVFTLTATDATHFSAVGSISGSIGTITVGTPFTHAKLEITIAAGGTAFVAGDAFQLATAPKWTQLRGPVTATATRWRILIEATAGANCEIGEIEMMSAYGGSTITSGGTASASSGTAANAFDANNTTRVQLTSAAGWVEYAFGSAVTIKEVALKLSSATLAGSSAMPRDFRVEYFNGTSWVPAASFRNESAWGVDERRVFKVAPYIWQAPGNDGVSQIIVGAHPFQNAGTGWYNARLQGYTAYDASAGWINQPGSIIDPGAGGTRYGPILPLSNGSIGYWFVRNGRRCVIEAKCGSTYGSAYLGLILPYASPGVWPYPLFVGGSLAFGGGEPASTSTKFLVGSGIPEHCTYPLPFKTNDGQAIDNGGSPARLRKPDGTWRGFLSRSDFYDPKSLTPGATTWPYAYDHSNVKPNLDGTYPLFPVVLLEQAPDNAFGQLDGVCAVTGSSLSAEATITVDPLASAKPGNAENWVAFPDALRSNAGDFYAVRLD
jgi:hypothetical protein